jgi:hypothetical protein
VVLLYDNGQGLIVGLDADGQRFTLFEILLGHFEADDDGCSLLGSRQQFCFWRKRRLGIVFQRWEGLEVAVEVDDGCGLVFLRFAARGSELSFDGVYPERFFSGVAKGQGDGNQDDVLLRDVDGRDEVNGAGTLRFGTLFKGENSNDGGDGNDADDHDSGGRQIALGGAEFFAIVEFGDLRRGLRFGSDSGLRGPGLVGHAVIVDETPFRTAEDIASVLLA